MVLPVLQAAPALLARLVLREMPGLLDQRDRRVLKAILALPARQDRPVILDRPVPPALRLQLQGQPVLQVLRPP